MHNYDIFEICRIRSSNVQRHTTGKLLRCKTPSQVHFGTALTSAWLLGSWDFEEPVEWWVTTKRGCWSRPTSRLDWVWLSEGNTWTVTRPLFLWTFVCTAFFRDETGNNFAHVASMWLVCLFSSAVQRQVLRLRIAGSHETTPTGSTL